MSPKKLYNFLIDPDLAQGLKALKERDGVGESETIRRALRRWLEEKGVLSKPARPTRSKRAGKA
jgi:hypothetical protein